MRRKQLLLDQYLIRMKSMFDKGIKTAYYSYFNEFSELDVSRLYSLGYGVFSFEVEGDQHVNRIITSNQKVYDELKTSGFFDALVTRHTSDDKNQRVNEWLGNVLGFPPKCSHKFAYVDFEMYGGVPNIGVDYGGLRFRTFDDTWVDCIEWLLETKPCTTKLKIEVDYYYTKDDGREDTTTEDTFSVKPGIDSQLLINIISEKFNLDIEKGRSYKYEEYNNGISM